ncbi:hypothetical protein P0Y35_07015 [Kiritimatiellaeota bacterium B1221]|nr:hypothetical protein [Kiritimatiellaeota bacterium B1221]
MKKTSHLLLLSALFLSVGNLLQADLLAYEGFDSSVYNTTAGFANNNLSGQGIGSGSGFTVDWGAATSDGETLGGSAGTIPYWLNTNNSSASAYYSASTGQASYTDGNSQTLATTAGQSTFTGDGTRVSLQRFTSTGTSAPNVLYLSALVTLDGSATDLSIGFASVNTGSNDDRPFSFGFNVDNELTTVGWGSGTSNSTPGGAISSVSSYGAGTYLLVAKITNSGGAGDTLDLWLDPLLGNEAGSGSAELTVTGGGFFVGSNSSWSVDGLVLDSSGTGSVSVDELRVGTTWDDVTPTAVPEASTLVLSMLSLVTIIGLRSSRNRR